MVHLNYVPTLYFSPKLFPSETRIDTVECPGCQI
jgi:hypothetical protein